MVAGDRVELPYGRPPDVLLSHQVRRLVEMRRNIMIGSTTEIGSAKAGRASADSLALVTNWAIGAAEYMTAEYTS